MNRVRPFVLCVVAMIGVGAIASAGASASLPEYRYCVKAQPPKTGEFTESACATHSAMPHRGSWEIGSWAQARKTTLKGTFGANRLVLYAPKNDAEPWAGGVAVAVIYCKKGRDDGDVTGAKTSTETITLIGCESEGKKCTTSGAGKGTIVTAALAGELGYVAGGVGTQLMPAGGEKLAEFECTPEAFTVSASGSAIAVDSGNINTLAKQGERTLAIVPETSAQEVVFGEFPSGEGPFFITSEASPVPGRTFGSSFEGVATIKFGSFAEIEA
jgi:hypothetical protein